MLYYLTNFRVLAVPCTLYSEVVSKQEGFCQGCQIHLDSVYLKTAWLVWITDYLCTRQSQTKLNNGQNLAKPSSD